MSDKIKFKKLQLPKIARSNSNQIPNSQISKFFSNNKVDKSNTSHSQKNYTSSSSNKNDNSNNIVLILSDEDSNNTESTSKLSDDGSTYTERDENCLHFLPVNNNNFSQSSSISKNNSQNNKQTMSKENNELSLPTYNFQETKVPTQKSKISKFFDETINDDAFDTTYIPSKKTKLSENINTAEVASSNQSKIPAKRKRKKQTTIKSAFTKNEEIFSDIMAQHSMADNFNPDEIQMALALSMSENQPQSHVYEDNNENRSKNLNIRNKLEIFGFKTGEKKDYNLEFYIPIANKKKTKWKNRFTALTLRDSEKQLKKINNYVEIFLNNQNVNINYSNFDTKYEYETCSSYLQNLQTNYEFIKNCNFVVNETQLENFYITELFSPTKSKIGSLMKKYENIPGRSISPKKYNRGEIIIDNNEKKTLPALIEICDEIESNTFDLPDNIKSCFGSLYDEKNIKENLYVVSDGNENEIEILVDTAGNTENTPKICIEEEAKNSELFNCSHNEVFTSPYKENNNLNRSIRSPDLFSDYEFNISAENNDQEDTSIADNIDSVITHYEKFSSDEVKISQNNLSNESPKSSSNFLEKVTNDISDYVIDLTQEDKFEEISSSSQYLSQTNESKENTHTQDLNSSEMDSIVLSDDEVNYSMALLGSVKKNKSVIYNAVYNRKDFSILELIKDDNEVLSNFNDNDEDCIQIKNVDNFKTKINPMSEITSPLENTKSSDISFSKKKNSEQNLPKCRKSISESFSNISYNSPSIDFTLKSFRQQTSDYEFRKDCFRLSPVELIDCTDENFSKIGNNLSDKKQTDQAENQYFVDDDFDLTKLRNEFGIKKTPHKEILHKTTSESTTCNYSHRLLEERYSNNIEFNDILEVEDEFDLLVNSPVKPLSTSNIPQDFDKLLTAEIISCSSDDASNDSFNLTKLQQKFGIEKTPNIKYKTSSESTGLASSIKYQPSTSMKRHLTNIEGVLIPSVNNNLTKINSSKTLEDHLTEIIRNFDSIHESKEVTIGSKIYVINTKNVSEKPYYENWTIIQIHAQLDKFGIKPLTKKQGVILLEYIYNQMHPYIIENEDQTKDNEFIQDKMIAGTTSKNYPENLCAKNYNIKDCFGDKLCINDGLLPELKNENYIFQTNISKKILTALLPLHIAWFNLIKSDNKLRETVLNYEPIDLQEIYLFFKSIGYRYDPKDIKKFFDDRCIIFRFDLSESTNNRHVKKTKKKNSV